MPVGAGGQRRLVGGVRASLDERQLADVARQRRLGYIEPRRMHQAPQLLLAAHRLPLDHVQNHRLAAGFHK